MLAIWSRPQRVKPHSRCVPLSGTHTGVAMAIAGVWFHFSHTSSVPAQAGQLRTKVSGYGHTGAQVVWDILIRKAN